MWGPTYGCGGLKGESPAGDSRISEISERTGLPARAAGLWGQRRTHGVSRSIASEEEERDESCSLRATSARPAGGFG